MIRVDAVWLAVQPLDVRLGTEAALARVVTVPISNNWVENHIRPLALGRSNWLFAGSLRAGKRAAAIMSPAAPGADQQARAVCAPQERVGPAANTPGQPDRRAAAAAMDASARR